MQVFGTGHGLQNKPVSAVPYPGRGLQNGGDGFPAHAGNHDVVRFVGSQRVQAVAQPNIDDRFQPGGGHRAPGRLYRPRPQIRRHRPGTAAGGDQRRGKPGVIGANIRQAAAGAYIGSCQRQPFIQGHTDSPFYKVSMDKKRAATGRFGLTAPSLYCRFSSDRRRYGR